MKKKIFLDECVPHRLSRDFSNEYEVQTSRSLKWNNSKLEDKPLIRKLEEHKIDLLLTVDQNIKYEQNLKKQKIQILCLRAHDNKRETLKAHIPRIEAEIEHMGRSEKYKEIDLRSSRNIVKEKSSSKVQLTVAQIRQMKRAKASIKKGKPKAKLKGKSDIEPNL